jgi:hypothetical protein
MRPALADAGAFVRVDSPAVHPHVGVSDALAEGAACHRCRLIEAARVDREARGQGSVGVDRDGGLDDVGPPCQHVEESRVGVLVLFSKDGLDRRRIGPQGGQRSGGDSSAGGGLRGSTARVGNHTARTAELYTVPTLLDALKARGFVPATAAMDRGYDYGPVDEACSERDVLPIIARRRSNGSDDGRDLAPTCEHGVWTFAGADFKRKATKWRCPTGECRPASKWVRADRRNPLVPRSSKRFGQLYAGRAAVEREFGRLQNEYGLTPLRIRGIERVALHADLTMLARLSVALARARTLPLAA